MSSEESVKPESVKEVVQEKPKPRGLQIMGFTIPWIVVLVIVLVAGYCLYKKNCLESVKLPFALSSIPDSEMTTGTPEGVSKILKTTV